MLEAAEEKYPLLWNRVKLVRALSESDPSLVGVVWQGLKPGGVRIDAIIADDTDSILTVCREPVSPTDRMPLVPLIQPACSPFGGMDARFV